MIGISFGDAFRFVELLFKGAESYLAFDRRFFTDHIDPCFKKLEAVHHDYLASFQEIGVRVRAMIDRDTALEFDAPSNREKLREIFEFALRERVNLRTSREAVQETSRAWTQTQSRNMPAEAKAFFEAVQDYFFVMARSSAFTGYSTGYKFVVDNLQQALRESADWNEFGVAEYIVRFSDDFSVLEGAIEDKWRNVATAYGRSQIALLR